MKHPESGPLKGLEDGAVRISDPLRARAIWQTIANCVVICLLGLIAYAAFTVPGFYYNRVLSRQQALEVMVQRLEGGFAEVKGSADAIAGTTPGLLSELSQQYSTLSEELSKNRKSLIDVSSKILALELRVGIELESSEGPTNIAAAKKKLSQFLESYTTPIQLPIELKEKADSIATYDMLHWDYERFVSEMSSRGLIPYTSPSRIAPEVQEELRQTFDFYLTNLWINDVEDRLLKNTLVTEYSAQRNYLEVALDASSNVVDEALKGAPEGVTYIRGYHDLGVKRVFVFPFAEHPEFMEFNLRADNAKDHLVRDLSLLAEHAPK